MTTELLLYRCPECDVELGNNEAWRSHRITVHGVTATEAHVGASSYIRSIQVKKLVKARKGKEKASVSTLPDVEPSDDEAAAPIKCKQPRTASAHRRKSRRDTSAARECAATAVAPYQRKPMRREPVKAPQKALTVQAQSNESQIPIDVIDLENDGNVASGETVLIEISNANETGDVAAKQLDDPVTPSFKMDSAKVAKVRQSLFGLTAQKSQGVLHSHPVEACACNTAGSKVKFHLCTAELLEMVKSRPTDSVDNILAELSAIFEMDDLVTEQVRAALAGTIAAQRDIACSLNRVLADGSGDASVMRQQLLLLRDSLESHPPPVLFR